MLSQLYTHCTKCNAMNSNYNTLNCLEVGYGVKSTIVPNIIKSHCMVALEMLKLFECLCRVRSIRLHILLKYTFPKQTVKALVRHM